MGKNTILILLILFIGRNGSDLFPADQWQYYYRKGHIEYQANMFDFAIENLTKSLRLNKKHFLSANLLADIYLKKNDYKNALHYWKLSLQINDRQDTIHYKVGELYDFIGHDDKAFHHYTRSITINPKNIKSHTNIIKHYVLMKDKVNTEKHFLICYNVCKSVGEKLHSRAYREEQKRNELRALELYRKSIEECPVLIKSYFSIVELHRRRKEYKKAEVFLEMIKLIRPDNEKAYIYLAHIQFSRRIEKNRRTILRRAIFNLKKAISINPKNSEPYFLLSEIYRLTGEREKSIYYNRKGASLEK